MLKGLITIFILSKCWETPLVARTFSSNAKTDKDILETDVRWSVPYMMRNTFSFHLSFSFTYVSLYFVVSPWTTALSWSLVNKKTKIWPRDTEPEAAALSFVIKRSFISIRRKGKVKNALFAVRTRAQSVITKLFRRKSRAGVIHFLSPSYKCDDKLETVPSERIFVHFFFVLLPFLSPPSRILPAARKRKFPSEVLFPQGTLRPRYVRPRADNIP